MATRLGCQHQAQTPGPEAGNLAFRGSELGALVVSAALPRFGGLLARTGGHMWAMRLGYEP